jgi:hypothetical protein
VNSPTTLALGFGIEDHCSLLGGSSIPIPNMYFPEIEMSLAPLHFWSEFFWPRDDGIVHPESNLGELFYFFRGIRSTAVQLFRPLDAPRPGSKCSPS